MSKQVARIDAELARRSTAQDEPTDLTEVGNADRFIAQHGKNVRFVPGWGWLVWTGTHWANGKLAVRDLMIETARAIHREAAEKSSVKAQEALARWARQSQQMQRIQGSLWCAQSKAVAEVEHFNQNTWLLPVANGTLNLRTAELEPHRRGDYFTRVVPIQFDQNAECPVWLAFLNRVLPDEELQTFVRRLAGYSLTGSTDEQVLAFLYGNGRNGKSVFIETLAALLGTYHKASRIESLSITRGGGIPNDIASFQGARLVTVSETSEGSRLNESLIKDLTGGDTITARFLRHEFFDFRPQFKLWIRGNHKPQIRGTDDGIWRRMLLVPFTVQIPSDEVDSNLPEKLRRELPGILAWAVRGCLEWQRLGLRAPAAVARAVSEYRDEMDIMGEFLSECCIIGAGYSAPASELHSVYRDWCHGRGEQSVSQRRFGMSLAERGFEKTKPKTVVWHGIGLLTDRDCRPSDHSDLSRSSPPSRAHNQVNAEQRAPRSERSEYTAEIERAEYRFADSERWLFVKGAPGQSYDALVQSLHRRFANVAEVRPYNRGGP